MCLIYVTWQVRSTARMCYRMFAKTWPERSRRLFMSFDPVIQRVYSCVPNAFILITSLIRSYFPYVFFIFWNRLLTKRMEACTGDMHLLPSVIEVLKHHLPLRHLRLHMYLDMELQLLLQWIELQVYPLGHLCLLVFCSHKQSPLVKVLNVVWKVCCTLVSRRSLQLKACLEVWNYPTNKILQLSVHQVWI